MLRAGVSTFLAAGGALALNAFPSAPLFMLAFSEALALVLVLGVLMATIAHRHWAAIPLLLLLSLTRPVAAPFAVVFLAHGLAHWRTDASGRTRRLLPIVLAAVIALASPWTWSFIAARYAGPAEGPAESGLQRTQSIL
jgi:hypothetical protein